MDLESSLLWIKKKSLFILSANFSLLNRNNGFFPESLRQTKRNPPWIWKVGHIKTKLIRSVMKKKKKNLCCSSVCKALLKLFCFWQKKSWRTILSLAFQSLGVVYGDLSTSPLYVYKSTFAEDIAHSDTNEEIYGVLSFVFWTLTLVPLLKYVFIVLQANDNGEGGTFALYSLLCRHARVSSLPNCQVADEELSDYRDKKDSSLLSASAPRKSGIGPRIRAVLERHGVLQRLLLVLALIGTCMVIGDGVLTPAISGFFFFFFFLVFVFWLMQNGYFVFNCCQFYFFGFGLVFTDFVLIGCWWICIGQFSLQFLGLSFPCLKSIINVSFFFLSKYELIEIRF